MQLEADAVMVYLDQWGLRRLFSLALRRRGAPRKRGDSITEEFFALLVKHWGAYKPNKKAKKGEEEVEKLDEDALVDASHLSDAEVTEGADVHLHRAVTDAYMDYTVQQNVVALCLEDSGEAKAESAKKDSTSSDGKLDSLDGKATKKEGANSNPDGELDGLDGKATKKEGANSSSPDGELDSLDGKAIDMELDLDLEEQLLLEQLALLRCLGYHLAF